MSFKFYSRFYETAAPWLGLILVAVIGIITPRSARAVNEYRELYRGARAQAMGNAFTAVADDEEALYYNPAGLAGIERTALNFVVADGEVGGNMITDYQGTMKAFSGTLGPSTLNNLVGKNAYLRGSLSPTYVTPNFAIGFLADQQLGLRSADRVFPTSNLGYQSTLGIQAGMGFSLSGKKSSKSKEQADDFRVGFAAKILWRRGGYYDLPLAQVLTISETQLKNLIGSYEQGYGGDIGFQWVRHATKRLTFKSGLAWTDIGDVTFAGNANAQKSNMSLGVAGIFEGPLTRLTLAADYRQLFRTDDWRKNAHFGLEVALPIVSVYAGLSQMALTYGAGVDFWLVRIMALTYTEQLSTFAFQETERRYMLHVALRFGF